MSRKKTRVFSAPAALELIIFDFDGVFTDNKVYTSQDGAETVVCDRRDGLGINMLKKLNVPMFILSMEQNPVVNARAKKIGLAVEKGCDNKKQFLEGYFREKKINADNVIYVGNDLNDLAAMQMVGFPVCPNDSHEEIIKISSYILEAKGGDGAVRELAELIILNQGGKDLCLYL